MVRRKVICNSESRQEIKNTLVNLKPSRSIHTPAPAFSFSFKDQVDSQLKVLQALQEGGSLEEEEEDDFFCECDQEDVVELLDAKEGEEEEDIEIVLSMEKILENSLGNDDEDEEDIVDVNNDLASLVASDEIDSLNSYRDHPSPLFIKSVDSMLQDSIVIEKNTHRDVDEETDEVYKKYCEIMRWYDILGRDRTYGLGKSF